MIYSNIVGTGIYLWSDYHSNISGYAFLVTTGSVTVFSKNLGRTNSFLYLNTGNYSQISASFVAWNYAGGIVESSSKTISFVTPVIAAASLVRNEYGSFIYVSSNVVVSSILINGTVNLRYTGGTKIYLEEIPNASFFTITDQNGVMSTGAYFNIEDRTRVDTVDYYSSPDYEQEIGIRHFDSVVNYTFVDTGNYSFRFTDETLDSGIEITRDTGNLYSDNYDTILIKRTKYFLGSPVMLFANYGAGEIYIGTTRCNHLSYRKVLGYTGVNYVGYVPHFKVV